jgi:hypothetical protein
MIRSARSVWVATGAAVIALLAVTSAAAAAVTPAAGATYPVGTWIKGVCDMRGGNDGFNYTTLLPKDADGKWHPPKVGDSSQPPTYRTFRRCTELLDSPGQYRVYLVHYDTRSALAGGCGCLDRVGLEAQFTVVAGGPNPCHGKENQITDVSTPSGASTSLHDLQGSLLSAGQTLTADQDVQLTFGDGAILRLKKGSSIKIASCTWTKDTPKLPFKIRLGLVLGAIWAKITPNTERMEVRTCPVREACASFGVRGTVFGIQNNGKGQVTAHLDKSVMTITPLWRPASWKTTTMTAGHTATLKGKHRPVIRKSAIVLSPHF